MSAKVFCNLLYARNTNKTDLHLERYIVQLMSAHVCENFQFFSGEIIAQELYLI